MTVEAITEAQSQRLTDVLKYRQALTHELITFPLYDETELDVSLYRDAVTILKDLSRFWVQVERDIGMFDDHPDVDLDDIVPLRLIMLQYFVDAVGDGLAKDLEQEN